MIIQNSSFYFSENENFGSQKNIKTNISRLENYNISNESTFRFNDEKNNIIKKQVIKQLGERSNLWKK